ncbi:MAG: hypothetical protein KF787_12065 [Phycisphaeraceae bacterium]|nr:hypothetical protein [Phycisphaerae bacterium]MBX3393371.1 hypothetical protein [Phycisphaeraceae bacterium]
MGLDQIRWKLEDLLLRMPAGTRRRGVIVCTCFAVASVASVFVYRAWVNPSGQATPSADQAEFRERVSEALMSEAGRTDLEMLNRMTDKALRREVQGRLDRLNALSREDKVETPEGQAAWAALLRASQVNDERLRRRPSNDD